ncbi:MAG: helix-turn-helix transcriptional regulator [Alphaproteobacteria bacterium]|nr:helix-turn-helix transcriptional regulator [Alphaproteobacteria bacterium]
MAAAHRKALGRVIRRRRLELGLSQEGFAEKVGLHRTYVGAVERGERNISFDNIVRVARALGVSSSELLIEVES